MAKFISSTFHLVNFLTYINILQIVERRNNFPMESEYMVMYTFTAYNYVVSKISYFKFSVSTIYLLINLAVEFVKF